MKNLKLLNDKKFSILVIFLSIFTKNVFANEPVDIWNTQDPNKNKIENNEKVENENSSSSSIFINNSIASSQQVI